MSDRRYKLVAEGPNAKNLLRLELEEGPLGELFGARANDFLHAPIVEPLILERGLSGADADALLQQISSVGRFAELWTAAVHPDPSATAIAELSARFERPVRVIVDQPAFNRRWPQRAAEGQRAAPVDPDAHWALDCEVRLLEVGPEAVRVLRELRRLYPEASLVEVKGWLDRLPHVLIDEVSSAEATLTADILRDVGATVEVRQPARRKDEFDLKGLDRATVEAGTPGRIALQATETEIRVLEYRVGWDGHHPYSMHRPTARFDWPLTTADDEALDRAIEAAIAARQATFRVCDHCGTNTPPEWWSGPACSSCAEKHFGIVH